MASKTRQILLIRRFLNRAGYHGGAYVMADVEREISTWTDKNSKRIRGRTRVWASLEIHDCARQISLSLDTETKPARCNTLRKLDLLIDTLTRLRDVLADEFAVLDQLPASDRRAPVGMTAAEFIRSLESR